MRDAILEKAEQKLIAGGYDKLNFATIAKDLNTTRANLHYHFKNKETLAIEVTRKYHSYYADMFSALRETFKGNFIGFFEAVDNYIWMKVDDSDDISVKGCNSLMSDPELPASIAKLSREFYKKFELILAGVIQDAIDNKEIRADIEVQREATRCHVLMMGIGSGVQHLSSSKQAKEQLGGLLVDWANSLK